MNLKKLYVVGILGFVCNLCSSATDLPENAICDAIAKYYKNTSPSPDTSPSPSPDDFCTSVLISLHKKINRAGMFTGTPDDCHNATMSVGTLAGLDSKPLAALAAKVKYYVDMAQKANTAFAGIWAGRKNTFNSSSNCKDWYSGHPYHSTLSLDIPKYYDVRRNYYFVKGGSGYGYFLCSGGSNACGGEGPCCSGCNYEPQREVKRVSIKEYYGTGWKPPK